MTLPTLNGASRFRPRDRQSELSQTRNLKMARSAHAYVRGSTVKFYEWLEDSAGKVPTGPPIWICGDCHVGNLGPLADAKGRVAIQIRDLDQTGSRRNRFPQTQRPPPAHPDWSFASLSRRARRSRSGY